MRHAADTNELLEIAGDELRAVVGDDPRRDAGELLAGALDDLFNVRLGHRLPQLPVDDEATTAIQEAAEVVEGAGDVDVGDIDMPVLMRLRGVAQTLSLFGKAGAAIVTAGRLF